MTTVIIDYGSGNICSVYNALQSVADNQQVCVITQAAPLYKASRVVLPGVGAFADCRKGLMAIDGMEEALDSVVRRGGVPFLGICVGMQVLVTRGEEHQSMAGLDWLGGRCGVLSPRDSDCRVPHIGWNTMKITSAHPIFTGIPDDSHVYFANSFRVFLTTPGWCLATTRHAEIFPSVIGRDNILGFQFHPEKSQHVGRRLLGNFLRWTP